MSKSVGTDQSHAIMAILATNVNWKDLDGELLQKRILGDPTEAGKQFTIFLKDGARRRMMIGDLKIVTAPLDPASFIGEGWKSVPEEQDEQSNALAEVDIAKVEFISCLREKETSIKGKEKLCRLKQEGRIRYGATVFMGLWKNYQDKKENSVLERAYQAGTIGDYLDFFGDILRVPDGSCYVLFLCHNAGGRWRWDVAWLGNDWRARHVSAVSSQVDS